MMISNGKTRDHTHVALHFLISFFHDTGFGFVHLAQDEHEIDFTIGLGMSNFQ